MVRRVVAGLVMGGVLTSLEARAAEPGAPAKRVEFSAGVLGLVGGNLFTTPDNRIPADYEGLGFAGDAGGFGWGIAAYGEGRFFRHLGIGLTLGYDRSVLQREVTYSNQLGSATVDEKITIGSTRLGLMAKGVLPTPFGRLWLGLGPQFVLNTSSEGEIDVPSNVGNAAAIQNLIHVEETNSTLLDFGGGLAVHAGDLIEIPFEIRASKNLSQEDDWLDRVTVHPSLDYDVKTQSSWEFRMAIGVGARF
jgi:hypothetical protein